MPQCSKLIAVALVFLVHFTCSQAQDVKYLPEPEIASQQTLDGRQVIRYEHASKPQWGYKSEQTDYFNLLPAKADIKNAPLRVILHSAGGSADKALDFAFKNKGWFHFYEGADYHVLYLDCRKNKGVDWWWGYDEIKRNPVQYKDTLTPTEQRVLATIEWVVQKYNVDRNRIYLSGISMGGSGSLGIGLCRGDIFAAISVCVPAGVEHMEFRMANGKYPAPPPLFNFSSPVDGWSKGQERLLACFEKIRYSLFFAWEPFGHSSDVSTANPAVVEFPWLSIRKNEAYPVFTGASTDNRYPGFMNKTNADQRGQINGYFRWKNLEDSAQRFAMELRLIKNEELRRPIKTPMASVASISFRRLQNFEVRKGTVYKWSLQSGENILESGTVTVGEDGVLTIPSVTISTLPKRLQVTQENDTASPSQFWLQEKGSATKAKNLAAKEREPLPRVLLLGDSISLGYDKPVRKLLAGKATVVHSPENCQSTVFGLAKIEAWLGDKPWDVIHFNWGIWDAHHLKDNRIRTTPEEYERNLRTLVSRLKATGAKLIWASTTPLKGRIEQGGIWVEESEIPIRNAIASKVMKENGIPINDLYQKVLPHLGRFHSKDGCHFTSEGYDVLAQRVVESVDRVIIKDNKGSPL